VPGADGHGVDAREIHKLRELHAEGTRRRRRKSRSKST
jgi:hypothetical protein